MSNSFTSKMSKHIEAFLAEKHALGYVYAEGERYLKRFDNFCKSKFPNETAITRELATAWAIPNDNERKAGIARRISPVREMARFLQRRDIDAYIIPKSIGGSPGRNFAPHIFTDDELTKIFYASDYLCFDKRPPTSHLVAPVMLRLMYSCGLRPFEVREIKRKNINLSTGVVFIPESKMRKDRFVVMSDDMTKYCTKYDNSIRKINPNSNYFFPATHNSDSVFDRHWLARILTKSISRAGLTDFSGNHPRPYDFRHTFATKTLYRWFREGRDLDASLPYLSAYMGHAKFEHTSYYIHLVPEFFLGLPDKLQKQYAELLPEVSL